MGYSFFELLKDSINTYMPLLPFYTSENTKKTEVFGYFQEV